MNENIVCSVVELLCILKKRHDIYLIDRSFSSLYAFISGVQAAHDLVPNVCANAFWLPYGFNDWIAQELGYRESTMGWGLMIRKKYPDDHEAFDAFFDLLDSFMHQK